jgi:hypothetical protein
MLQELKKEELEASKVNDEEDDPAPLFLEEQVGRFSCGVAAVIIPTVLNLMEVMKTQQEAVPPLET